MEKCVEARSSEGGEDRRRGGRALPATAVSWRGKNGSGEAIKNHLLISGCENMIHSTKNMIHSTHLTLRMQIAKRFAAALQNF